MDNFLFGCMIGIAAALCIAAPFLLPWHTRVRYLVSVPAIDPRLGTGPLPRHELREVRVAAVETCRGQLELAVEEVGAGHNHRRTALVRDACEPAVIARLDGWAVLDTPLLLIVDDERRAHVYGPDGAVTNLALVTDVSREDA